MHYDQTTCTITLYVLSALSKYRESTRFANVQDDHVFKFMSAYIHTSHTFTQIMYIYTIMYIYICKMKKSHTYFFLPYVVIDFTLKCDARKQRRQYIRPTIRPNGNGISNTITPNTTCCKWCQGDSLSSFNSNIKLTPTCQVSRL